MPKTASDSVLPLNSTNCYVNTGSDNSGTLFRSVFSLYFSLFFSLFPHERLYQRPYKGKDRLLSTRMTSGLIRKSSSS